MQVDVTARDEHANTVTSGDAGFVLASPATSAILADSYSRTTASGVTTFSFRMTEAGVYILRFETAAGELVHQNKIRIVPGGVSHTNSLYAVLPASFEVGGTLVAELQVCRLSSGDCGTCPFAPDCARWFEPHKQPVFVAASRRHARRRAAGAPPVLWCLSSLLSGAIVALAIVSCLLSGAIVALALSPPCLLAHVPKDEEGPVFWHPACSPCPPAPTHPPNSGTTQSQPPTQPRHHPTQPPTQPTQAAMQVRDAYSNVLSDTSAAEEFVLSASLDADPTQSVPVRLLPTLMLTSPSLFRCACCQP